MEGISYNQEQLHQLVEQAKKGNERARNAIVRYFEKKVRCMVKAMRLPEHLQDGAVQEALMALGKAIKTFKADRGASFSTWALRIAGWSIKAYLRSESGLSTHGGKKYRRVWRAYEHAQQRWEVEVPTPTQVAGAYRALYGEGIRKRTIRNILRMPGTSVDRQRSENIEGLELPKGHTGSQDNVEQASLAARLNREGDYTVAYALMYKALEPTEAPNFAVLHTLHVRCGMSWVEIRELAKSPTFNVEGFRSWEAVHFWFQLPAWVPTEWEEARKALLVRGGKVPQDPSSYGKRFTEAGGRIKRYLGEGWRS